MIRKSLRAYNTCATLKGSDNKLVKAYLDFILSEEGQALVLAQGAVPVK